MPQNLFDWFTANAALSDVAPNCEKRRENAFAKIKTAQK